ncbi:MAG: hypothetical protein OJF55_002548 [Rhodanobacteraceae bacterium]|nr:MAG: hypothetical protein OJF55_002548 [Rhodanobacteraceae bacterium]
MLAGGGCAAPRGALVGQNLQCYRIGSCFRVQVAGPEFIKFARCAIGVRAASD